MTRNQYAYFWALEAQLFAKWTVYVTKRADEGTSFADFIGWTDAIVWC